MEKIEQHHTSIDGKKNEERDAEGKQKRSEKESAGDGFKLLVSQADTGSAAAWLRSASHTISPLFTISPLSISLHLPPGVATPSVMHSFSRRHTAASDTAYIIPSRSHSHSFGRKSLYLTYTCRLLFLTHSLLPLPITFITSSQVFLSSRSLFSSLHIFLLSTPEAPYVTKDQIYYCKLIFYLHLH